MGTGSISFDSFANAIANEENIASGLQSSNNPYALELGDQGLGTTQAAGGNQLTNFGSLQDAYNALLKMFTSDVNGNSSIYSPSMSIGQYMTTYTGGNTNAGNTVANILGIDPSTPITAISTTAGTGASGAGIGSVFNPATGQANNPVTGQPLGSSASGGLVSMLPSWAQSLLGGGATGQAESSSLVLDGVAIVVGLIMIAGAVFGFKNLTTTVVEGVKSGAEVMS